MRIALIAFAVTFLNATAALAQQFPDCWYPAGAKAQCSTEVKVDENGCLKYGFHTAFNQPTNRYGHNILGDTPEWGGLEFMVQNSCTHGPSLLRQLTLPKRRVFEDIAPRFVDIDKDGAPEIVVVETDVNKGARLSIYSSYNHNSDNIKLLASTPYIGRSHRWLAPVGIADFNGDGDIDVAYIDRPHLAQLLRVWSYRNGKLVEIATAPNLTNHKIGWNFIAGGVRNCGAGPEMITADGAWRKIVARRFVGEKLISKEIGRYNGPESLKAALDC